jgi:hypothetical protein
MTTVVKDFIYQPIMSAYSMAGLNSPITRFLGTAVVAGGLTLVFKPSFAFDSQGNAYPWRLVDPNAKQGTAIPWYFIPAAAGFFGGFMI